MTPMPAHPALPVLWVSPRTPHTAALAAAPRTPEPARKQEGLSGRADRRPARLCLESSTPGLWLLRVAGRLDTPTLDTPTAAQVPRPADGPLDTADEAPVLVIDLGEVNCFERGGPESLRHAPYSTARRGAASPR